MDTPIIIVSGDAHAAAPIEAYRPYVPAKYHDALDELVLESEEYQQRIAGPAHPSPEAMEAFDRRGVMADGGEDGSFDLARRLREMDAEGCAAEIVHSGTQAAPPLWYGASNREHSTELQWVGVQGYHRWLADFMDAADGRLYGVAEPGPCLDLDATLLELDYVASHGFVSVGVPGVVADRTLPALTDPYFEPFWTACEDLGLVLSIHAGWGSPQGAVYKYFDAFASRMANSSGELDRMQVEAIAAEVAAELATDSESPFRLNMMPQQVMWRLMIAGVFDRHPNLKLALTEVRADWVPSTMDALDRLAAESAPELSLKPSEYFARQCIVSPSSIHRCEIEQRHDIGVERLLFGTDYPHHEGTWPNTREWIQVSMAGLPEDEVRAILGENAIRFYGLDRARLAEVADRIGPRLSELVASDAQIDRELLDHFDKRAGFSRPVDPVDLDGIEFEFRRDLARIA